MLELLTQLNDVLKASPHTRELVVLQASDSLTTTEASDLIGVSLPTLRRLYERGEIQGYKVGRHLRFFARDVAALPKSTS